MNTVQDVLRQFGLSRCLKSSLYALHAVNLAVNNDNRLEAVIKEIYMETASFYRCKWTSVERGIRTAAVRAWRVNPELLQRMAGYPMSAAPTASEFIEIVAVYILRSAPQAKVQMENFPLSPGRF